MRSELAAFRDVHHGEAIVVCGCGPSLKELADPLRQLTIGVNDVGRLFDPTYLVVVNPRSQFKGDRFAYVEHSRAQFLFTQLELGAVAPPVVRFKLGRFGGTDVRAGDVLHYTQNSPYVAVCLAAYMGARRIGLIGVDLTDGHFFASTGRHPLAGRLREIDAQYGQLAAALRKRGVELVNLSSVSRLGSLPRSGAAPGAERSDEMKPPQQPRTRGAIGQLRDALSETARKLGYKVARDAAQATHDPRVISIVWNGRYHRPAGPTLYCEHGWLPRSSFQISPRGINAASHIAPFRWDGAALGPAEQGALEEHLAVIKSTTHAGYYEYMQADKSAASGLPERFLLAPLQMEYDTNLVNHAPVHLRRMQGLIDYVSGLNAPWPVIFKQHPMDAQRGNAHLRLLLRRQQDLLWPQARGNVHQMLKSGRCRGVLTINSNVAHDSLLWDVPAVVLGRNIWPAKGEVTPFLTAVPRDWSLLEASVTQPQAVACRRAYMHFLMRNQWTLDDARDPQRVGPLVESAIRARSAAAAPRTIAVLVPRRHVPLVNVVAENRGWLFETYKQRFAAAVHPGLRVAASEKPLRHADAWIFIRAREAARSPDPARSVVQVHDFADAGLYRPDRERAALRACGAVSLTHPLQKEIMRVNGLGWEPRHVVQPVGWSEAGVPRAAPDAVPTVAWIGRPARQGGADPDRLQFFIEAARGLRARVILVGEKLAPAAAALKRAGVDCAVLDSARYPQGHASAWLGSFDCVAITSAADSAPWPLFDALHAGVPVVSTPVGWAGELLADGGCGTLAETPQAMGEAIRGILQARERWRGREPELRASVAQWSTTAWIAANLEAARRLLAPDARREVA
jgi:glycosyltransferase involved in cell wall biosynthesis